MLLSRPQLFLSPVSTAPSSQPNGGCGVYDVPLTHLMVVEFTPSREKECACECVCVIGSSRLMTGAFRQLFMITGCTVCVLDGLTVMG